MSLRALSFRAVCRRPFVNSAVLGSSYRGSFGLFSSAATEGNDDKKIKKPKLRLVELGKSRSTDGSDRPPLTISDIKKSRKAENAAASKPSTASTSDDTAASSSSSSKALDDGRFVTYQFASAEELQKKKMDDRLKDAERWTSRKLTDEDARLLNKKLGIEEELAQIEKGGRAGKVEGASGTKSLKARAQQIAQEREAKAEARVKGFLEMNPYLCSGCGAPFQSRSDKDPGFLPKDKLQEHRKNAILIKEKQEAVRILEMAGIEVDSAAARRILEEANVSEDVIAGVQALGRSQRYSPLDGEEEEESEEGDEGDDDMFPEEIDFEIDLPEGMSVSAGVDNGARAAELKSQIKAATTSSPNMSLTVTDGGNSVSMVGNNEFINDISAEVSRSKKEEDKSVYFFREMSGLELDEMDGTAAIKARKASKRRALTPEEELVMFPSSGAPEDEADAMKDSICICQRCFRLQQYGQIDQSLRPGWSEHELLTPERFESLLGVIKQSKAVVLCIIDLFDLRGSLLANLKSIAGSNPIIIAANKLDLLPKDVSQDRITSWIYSEIKDYCGLVGPRDMDEDMRSRFSYQRNKDMMARSSGKPAPKGGTYFGKEREGDMPGTLRRSNVHLVSCESGYGMDALMAKCISTARESGNTVYVMGAANVGKSSFINRLLDVNYGRSAKPGQKKPSNKDVAHATVSNLPGTTLDFLKIRLPNGVTMIDTPGLLNKGQLTARLTTAELKQVIPSKPIKPVTLRVTEGKCVLVGGLAIVELEEGLPFFITFFVSNDIKLHPTDSLKAPEFLAKHAGSLVTPPSSPERLAELGAFQTHSFTVSGDSWRKSNTDIVIAGLGWISITGTGDCKIKVRVPAGIYVGEREALLPYEAPTSTAKFTGGRIQQRSRK